MYFSLRRALELNWLIVDLSLVKKCYEHVLREASIESYLISESSYED